MPVGKEPFVPLSLVRDSRRRSWILTYQPRAFIRGAAARPRAPRSDPPPRSAPFSPVTPILTLVCISISVTIAFWDLLH